MNIKIWSRRIDDQLYEWHLCIGRKGKDFEQVYLVTLHKTVRTVSEVEYAWQVIAWGDEGSK